MSDSVGKISLDLEVKSDLGKQINMMSDLIASKMKNATNNSSKNMFDNINKQADVAMSKMNSSIKNGLNRTSQVIKDTLSSAFSVIRNIKPPKINFHKSEDTKATKTAKASNVNKTRGSPVNEEEIKAQISNTEETLNNVNAKIDMQRKKLLQLKQSYVSAFNPNTKNKIQEQILKTEASINKLIGQSNKLGFKLSDLDSKLSSLKANATEAASGINNVSESTKSFSASARRSGNVTKKFNSNIKNTNQHMKNTGNSSRGASYGMAMMAKSMLAWGVIFPIVIRGLGAMANGMLNNLNTNEQFVSSLNQIKSNLTVAFTPIFYAILPAINALMRGLATITAYIASFISAIFGKTFKQSKQATQGLINAKKAMGVYGGAAKKAGKEAKEATNQLMGFDEINQLNSKNDSGADAGSGGGGGANVPQLYDTPGIDEMDSKIQSMVDNMKKKLQEAFNIFKDGFKVGFADTNFDGIKQSIDGIKKSLKDIFSDSEVVNAAKEWVKTTIYSLGQITGSVASIGVTIADNLLGGINLYLQQNCDSIKKYIVDMFDISSETETIIGNFATACADIFSVFRSDTAKQITADLIAIFANAFMGITEVIAKAFRDILDAITRPFIENKDAIKTAISETLQPIETVVGSIAQLVTNSMIKLNEVYDEHISPMFTAIGTGLSSIFSTLLEGYNTYVVPVLSELSELFSVLVSDQIQPLIDAFLDLIGKITDGITKIWTEILVPFINWIIESLSPLFASAFETIGKIIIDLGGVIADIIKGAIEVCGGLIDFLVGTFTGDWEQATKGLQTIWTGAWEIITSVIDLFDKYLSSIFTTDWSNSFGILGDVLNGFSNSSKEVWEGIKKIFNGINDFVSGTFTGNWEKAWKGVKNIFSGIVNSLEGVIRSPLNAIIGMINTVIGGLNGLDINIPDWVPSYGGKSFGLNIGKIPYLARGGIIDSPTLAMVGEAGKEAVVPLENTGFVSSLGQAVANAVGDKMQILLDGLLTTTNKESELTEIVLQIDKREIARGTIDGIRQLEKQIGKKIILI
ncbi:hypothetical protein [Clostridium sp. BJN0001]|uniref:phage tail protein n=1 Tax=Clostridium sp. BJN0001 TaxID=2930219 RepID=UPI001FD469AC|nr:hypothetical protein [Clostridium sp. BJN0001]